MSAAPGSRSTLLFCLALSLVTVTFSRHAQSQPPAATGNQRALTDRPLLGQPATLPAAETPGSEDRPQRGPSSQVAREDSPDADALASLLSDIPIQPVAPRGRLAATPNMFGDFFFNGMQADFTYEMFYLHGPVVVIQALDLPLAGGFARTKVSENNKAVPEDRVYFTYNYHDNALFGSIAILDYNQHRFSGSNEISDLNRYVVGIEKAFANGWSSIEVRMPFTSAFLFDPEDLALGEGGHLGNLLVSWKRQLARGPLGAAAAGLAVDVPTGSDVRLHDPFVWDANFRIHNSAVHLLPYVALLSARNGRFFAQGFVQLDIPLNGQKITSEGSLLGKYTEQALLAIDLQAGRWMWRNTNSTGFKGLASVAELHYTTALQSSDVVAETREFDELTPDVLAANVASYRFSNARNRVDLLNATVGVHAEFSSGTNIRVGGAFPLRGQSDRTFDAEFLVSVNHPF